MMSLLLRKGTINDIDACIDLFQSIRENMVHKEWFFLDSPEEFRGMMEEGIMDLWVVMDGSNLAAAFDLLRPGFRPFNYGYDLGLTEEELPLVINMDTAAVHPEYRGLGLQQKMIHHAEQQLCKEGRRILLCTVHPENQYSLENVLRQGYKIQKKMEKYGSIRYLLRKDIF